MAHLEFMHIGVLGDCMHGTPNLERRIAESPIHFAWVLALLFKRDDGGQDPPEWRIGDAAKGHELAIGIGAHGLLARISYIPGAGNGGDIDEDELFRWIVETRRLCAEYGRASVGDEYIGRLLSKAPSDTDSIQPSLTVSKVLETIGSPDIHSGFANGIYNGRGVVRRAIGEGGKPERELAERYRRYARQRSPDYPFVGSILESIAAKYDRQAQREDHNAQIERRLLGH